MTDLFPPRDAWTPVRRAQVAIVADDALGESLAADAAAAAEAEVAASLRLDQAASVLPAGVDAVLVELQRDHGAALDALLGTLQAAAASRTFASVVTVPPALIDLAIAAAPHPHVTILSETDAIGRAGALALALALAPERNRAREEGGGPGELARLSAEAARIASALARLSDRGWRAPPPVPPPPPLPIEGPAARLRRMVRHRRLRDRLFGKGLFADPAWDMLLDLAAARLEARQVAVSSLCIAAAVPTSTALRWIKTLIEEGLFVRIDDIADRRRAFVALSDQAAAAMDRYLEAIDSP